MRSLLLIFLFISPCFSIISESGFLALGESPVLPGVWHVGDGLDILSMRQMAPVFSMTYVNQSNNIEIYNYF